MNNIIFNLIKKDSIKVQTTHHDDGVVSHNGNDSVKQIVFHISNADTGDSANLKRIFTQRHQEDTIRLL